MDDATEDAFAAVATQPLLGEPQDLSVLIEEYRENPPFIPKLQAHPRSLKSEHSCSRHRRFPHTAGSPANLPKYSTVKGRRGTNYLSSFTRSSVSDSLAVEARDLLVFLNKHDCCLSSELFLPLLHRGAPPRVRGWRCHASHRLSAC